MLLRGRLWKTFSVDVICGQIMVEFNDLQELYRNFCHECHRVCLSGNSEEAAKNRRRKKDHC